MLYKYYITDVFTTRMFDGAQIAVFPHADGLDARQMQLIAREMNLSETAFVFSPNGSNTWRVRVFSPHAEINFAGHPVIATAYTLAETGTVKLNGKYTDIVLEENIGPIDVTITHDGGTTKLVQFTMKSQPSIDRFVPQEDQLAEILSLQEKDIEKIKYHTLLVSCDQPYLIVPLRSYQRVRDAKFNFSAWSQSSAPSSLAREMLLFSAQSDAPSSNFHGRLVGPEIGFNEDPPIGSAMPAFTGYLCAHEHIKKGTHTFVIDRGTSQTRKSVLTVEMDKNENKENVIRVGGPAVMVSEGSITLPD